MATFPHLTMTNVIDYCWLRSSSISSDVVPVRVGAHAGGVGAVALALTSRGWPADDWAAVIASALWRVCI